MLPRISTLLKQGALRRNAQPLRAPVRNFQGFKNTISTTQFKKSFATRDFTIIGPFRSFSTEPQPPIEHPPKTTPTHSETATSNNDLELLRTLAVGAPSNPTVQYIYLKELNKTNPEGVIEYYNNSKFTSNEETTKEYIKALSKLNRLDEVNLNKHNVNQSSNQSERPLGAAGPSTQYSSSQGTATNPVIVKMATSPWSILSTIGSVVIFGGLIYLLFFRDKGGFSEIMGSKVNEYQTGENKTKFSDVVGNEEAKKELANIVDYLKAPAKYAKFGVKLPKGVLLNGPPGCGKTLLARAIAGEAGVPFYFISGSEFEEIFVGVGARRVRALFKKAKETAPCIIFIDEIDAVGGKRDSFDNRGGKMTLNQMLTELDGFEENSGVVVIAATNLEKTLDAALTRPGRFDKKIKINPPGFKDRKSMFQFYLGDRAANNVTEGELTSIAKMTEQMTGADIENIVNIAATNTVTNHMTKITLTTLREALDEVVMGPPRLSFDITPSEFRSTAFHEAAHAILGLKAENEIYQATIVPRGEALGSVRWIRKSEVSKSKAEYLQDIDTAVAGGIAEEIIFGYDKLSSGRSSDLSQASRIARAMCMQFGMSGSGIMTITDEKEWSNLSSDARNKLDSEINNILDSSYKRVTDYLTQNKAGLTSLAEALIEFKSLSHNEVKAAFEGKNIKPMVERRRVEEEKLRESEKKYEVSEGTPIISQHPTLPVLPPTGPKIPTKNL